MADTLVVIGPLFLVLLVGFGAGYVERFRHAEPALNGFVFYFALPAFLFEAVASAPIGDGVPPAFFGIAVVVTLVTWALAYGGARLLAPGCSAEAAPLSLGAAYGNVGYFGVPIVVSVLGPDAALAAAFGQLVHNLLFMVGYPLIRSVAARSDDPRERLTATLWRVSTRALLLNPVALGVAAGVGAGYGNIELPAVVGDSVGLLGQAAIPAALFAVGLTLRPALAGIRSGGVPVGGVLGASAVKVVVSPLLTWGAAWLLRGEPLDVWSATLVLMSAMPTSATAFILSQEYDGDGRLVAATIVATSAAAVVSIPAIVLLL